MGAAPISSAATTRCAEKFFSPSAILHTASACNKKRKIFWLPQVSVRVCVSVPTLFWISNYYNNRPTIEGGPAARSLKFEILVNVVETERITRAAVRQRAEAGSVLCWITDLRITAPAPTVRCRRASSSRLPSSHKHPTDHRGDQFRSW